MRFAESGVLVHMLWLVPAMLALAVWAGFRARSARERFAAKTALAKISPAGLGARRVAKAAIEIAAIFFLMLALARPQWGAYWKEKRTTGIDIIFAIDTSKSMLARDLAPNRLAFAKTELKEFVKSLKGDRVGLIAFAGDAFLYCPLTTDYKGFFMILDTMDVDSIDRGGTSIASAITEAERAFKWAATVDKSLVVVSDGENTAGDIRKAIEAARKDVIQISCIGIGSSEGTFIEYRDPKSGVMVVKDKKGNAVISKLDEDLLRGMASETGGVYVRASPSQFGLDSIYKERLSLMKKRQSDEGSAKSYHERYYVPLAIALALVVCATFMTSARYE
jgi:Ca-activated chloride channel family protein